MAWNFGVLERREKHILCAYKSSVNEWISFFCSCCSRYFWAVAFFYRLHIFFPRAFRFVSFGLRILSALSSHYENHCISNSVCSKWVCRCVNWLFAYDTWFLVLLIVVLVASCDHTYSRMHTHTHETIFTSHTLGWCVCCVCIVRFSGYSYSFFNGSDCNTC